VAAGKYTTLSRLVVVFPSSYDVYIWHPFWEAFGCQFRFDLLSSWLFLGWFLGASWLVAYRSSNARKSFIELCRGGQV